MIKPDTLKATKTLRTLGNMKIGSKLGLSSGAAVMQLLCLGGVALWRQQTVEVGAAKSETESRMMICAQTISANLEGIGAHAANLSLSKRVDPEDIKEVNRHREDNAKATEELHSFADVEE